MVVLCFEEFVCECEMVVKYLYVEMSGDGGRVIKIVEKLCVGFYVNIGVYWFVSEKEFFELMKDILI